MKTFIAILLAGIFIHELHCHGQSIQDETDSLYQVTRLSEDPEATAFAHSRLAWIMAYTDLDAGFAHLDTAWNIFSQLEDEKQLAALNYKYGVLYRVAGDFARAHSYMDQYMDYLLENHDTLNLSNATYQKAVIYSSQGDYENSLKEYYRTLEAYEALKDSTAMGFTLNGIGIIYKNLENFPRAIDAFRQSIRIHEKLDDLDNLPDTYSNLGNVYLAMDEPDSALELFMKALDIDIRTKNNWGIAINNYSIAAVLIGKKRYAEAFQYLEKARQIQSENSYRNELMATLISMGVVRMKTGELQKSENYLLQALAIDAGSALNQMQVHQNLAELYEKKGDYQAALIHQKEYSEWRQKIFEEEKIRNIQRLEYQYETEKKDKAIANQQLDINQKELRLMKKNNQLTGASIGGFLLLLIFSGSWVLFRQRQKLKSKEIMALQGQQEILKLEALIAGEEKERTRLARDLHDGINGDLAVIKYRISSIDPASLNRKEKTAYREAMDMLDNSVEQIRRISHNLAPPSLQNFDLVEAIKQYCSRLNTTWPVNISFQYFGDRVLMTKEKETAIYRIIQELLNNIVRHSNASEALVQINKHDSKLYITVEDNGKGMDREKVSEGIGLQNIRSRVDFLKAGLEINTSAEGTSFSIDIDLEKANAL